VPAATEGSGVKAAFLFVDLLAGYWAEEIPVTVLKTKKLHDRNVDLEQLWDNQLICRVFFLRKTRLPYLFCIFLMQLLHRCVVFKLLVAPKAA
jgi:hypothetical protein